MEIIFTSSLYVSLDEMSRFLFKYANTHVYFSIIEKRQSVIHMNTLTLCQHIIRDYVLCDHLQYEN